MFFYFWLIYCPEQRDEGMGTEIERRTSKILCIVLEFPMSEILNSCLGWDDNFNSHWRENHIPAVL